MTPYQALLQPFQLKHLRLRNRIMSTSHEPAYAEEGRPKLRYRLYHEEKARGGLALTMIGGSAVVAPDSPPAFGNLHLFDDGIVADLQALAHGVHAHGAAVMCQITHLGRRTYWNRPTGCRCWRRPSCASPPIARSPRQWRITTSAVVRAYGAAARRCREGGMDGIEIEAYGHLLDAFWSQATNRRTDRYGGSLDNRMRFSLEVLDEIRSRVGSDYIVGIRMVVDEDMAGGLARAEGLEIARRLVATGMIDFTNVIRGHIDTDEGLSRVIPGMGAPVAPHLAFVGEIRAALSVPTFHAARIADVATASYAVGEGLVDMVGMTRAHMADPHIVAKILRGEEHRIRPCVGVGYCIDRIYEAGDALCIHSPATGREATMPHVIPRANGPARTVVVVGAGPAGLEAARVAAERGHRVVLFEAAPQPGGQVRLAAALARRREIIGIVGWLQDEIERLGVELRCNLFAEAGDVLAEAPDVVVIATGGIPNASFLAEGADLAVTSWDILGGQAAPGRDVLLFDDNGAHPGASCAEFLARVGTRLEFVTPERVVLPEIGGTNYPGYLKAFGEHGVIITLNRRLRAVRREGNRLAAVLYDEYARAFEERLVDQVVIEHGTLPADELYFELKPGSSNLGEIDLDALLAGRPQSKLNNPDGSYQLFRVGDAVASRNIHAAIYDSLAPVQGTVRPAWMWPQAIISFWIAFGSALGGVLRYWCSGLVARWVGETFPWGTIAVNVIGSLLIGLFATLSGPDGRLFVGTTASQFVMLGLLGGFTTFSSFSLQTPALAQNGEWLRAASNVVGSVVLCLPGVWLGHALAVAINRSGARDAAAEGRDAAADLLGGGRQGRRSAAVRSDRAQSA